MTDHLYAEEIKDFVLQLFHEDNMDELGNLTPIEFGVLSWHLGNFYCCPCGEALGGLLYYEP